MFPGGCLRDQLLHYYIDHRSRSKTEQIRQSGQDQSCRQHGQDRRQRLHDAGENAVCARMNIPMTAAA